MSKNISDKVFSERSIVKWYLLLVVQSKFLEPVRWLFLMIDLLISCPCCPVVTLERCVKRWLRDVC